MNLVKSLIPLVFIPLAWGNTATETVLSEQKKNHDMARVSQKKIDKIADQTETMRSQYRQVLKNIENAKVYNQQLSKLISQQEDEKKSIEEQLTSIHSTSKGIVPLMINMMGTLEKFVQLDLPFLPEERKRRISQLKVMMDRADVSVSEKYRRILEAYQVENEYGRTIEAYRGVLNRSGKKMTVDFFRLGRVAHYYQTLDGKVSAKWDHKGKKWVDLDDSFNRSLQAGIKMARKQTAPQLLSLPLKREAI